MNDGLKVLLLVIASGVEFLLIPFPFSLGPIAITIGVGLFVIRRKRKAKFAAKFSEGWT